MEKPGLADKLQEAFEKHDAKASGYVSQKLCADVFCRLGLSNDDAAQLIGAWRAVAKTEEADDGEPLLHYGHFIRWLVDGGDKEVLDAGTEAPICPQAAQSPASGFCSWVDRCARLLETRDEADFVQKKLIAAQVRAHIDQLSARDATFEYVSIPELERSRSRKNTKPSMGSSVPVPSLDWDGSGLLHKLLKEGPGKIPATYVEKVLDYMLNALPQKHPRPVTRLNVPRDGRVVVVGDTHGQLQDVLLLFLIYGQPSSKNIYLFNGDVADRGPNACEIYLLIFAFLSSDPESIVLTRGNHEDEQMNMMLADQGGGFYDECLDKYGEDTFFKFTDIFKLLPLACIVHEEVFVVHGGLPSGQIPCLADINAIRHTEVCCPPPDADLPEEKMFIGLLWSDPREMNGHIPNPRGAGSLWGPDVTKAFLAQNRLRWIIRSHELPHDYERGWMEHHLGLVFTVFSASNYCGYEVNWGAVALLTLGADGRVEQALREHNIPDFEALSELAEIPEQLARKQRCQDIGLTWIDCDRIAVGDRRVKLALRRLGGIVVEFKPELWKAFRARDPKNSGSVSREALVDGLTEACGDDLPWQETSKIWLADDAVSVDYRKFLDRFKVVLQQEKWCGWKSLVISDVYEELLNRNATASDIISLFDSTGDGIVSEQDFVALINQCLAGRLSESQVSALSRTIFAHACEDGIRIQDFLSRFTLAYVQSKGMASDQDASLARISTVLDQIGKLLVARQRPTARPPALFRDMSHQVPRLSLADAPSLDRGASVPPEALQHQRSEPSALMKTFEELDPDGSGFVSVDAFVHHVMRMPGFAGVRSEGEPLGEAGLRDVAETLANIQAGDGRIGLLQFARAFAAVDASGSADLADDLHEHILTFLYRHRHAMRTSCAEHDKDANGRVPRKMFAQVLEAVHFCAARAARQLTRAQMDALVESIVEDDGQVEYEAFLSSFEVLIA